MESNEVLKRFIRNLFKDLDEDVSSDQLSSIFSNMAKDMTQPGGWVSELFMESDNDLESMCNAMFDLGPKKAREPEGTPYRDFRVTINDAARRGDLDAVKEMLSGSPADRLALDDIGTVRILAAEHGHVDIVKYVADKCDEHRYPDTDGIRTNAFIAAAANNHVDVLKHLARDYRSSYESALFLACRNGCTDSVEYLLKDMSVDATNDSLFIEAAWYGNRGVMRALLCQLSPAIEWADTH